MKPQALLFLTMFIAYSCSVNSQSVAFEWARQMGGISNDVGQSLAVDPDGNIYITGYFSSTVDFDPGIGVINLTANGADDIFIAKMNAAGNFLWANRVGGASYDHGQSIAVDAAGNVYATGTFNGTVDFDAGTGVTNLVSTSSDQLFVSRYDSSGNFLWAKTMGTSGGEVHGTCVTVDGSSNIYLTGYFNGTIDFDPDFLIYNLTSNGEDDIFIERLDAAGNFVWAQTMGGIFDDIGYSITVDRFGSVYTTGRFQGTADFDPGSNVYNLMAAGGSDVFISKLDVFGNFVWAKNIGGTNYVLPTSLAVDAWSNVYTTGTFNGTVDFDPDSIGYFSLTPVGSDDVFVSKLNASGGFLWAKQLGGISDDYGYSVAVDSTGNVYSTGTFNSTADFDPGTGVYNLHSDGFYDIFISKLSPSGNFEWAKRLGGNFYDSAYSIAVDETGNIYTTGYFQSTVDFDPDSSSIFNLTSTSAFDIFVHKMSPVPVGIEENYCLNKILFFPNPATEWLSVKNLMPGYVNLRVQLINPLGKILLEEPITSNSIINIESLPTGIYFLRLIHFERIVGTSKVVKY